ncbi:helix-turn-helix domain-containing protein [Streptomyces achromogenes]|uniref:helix-turn-helix domain-containing protein n=1 Tax=Streptomyces achromogenes TaxID=67255 RepID=UPI003F4CB8BC
MNRAELGSALRTLRQASGKEAKAVARSAAMSASKLSKIEADSVVPSVVDVEQILTAIGGIGGCEVRVKDQMSGDAPVRRHWITRLRRVTARSVR